ncbi:hypothetical protein LTR62_008157 [Meristemomyces frigidus]|uniref:Zn(2)-C6 fungal-type domain-containing protein n=1 Tax=Meristemomyces frigidus TaxID=1508187 RepID=A0AAN7YHC7_9PEZI|nr:hypothetical protein LTR62_008157 [Meristemomyces frigidus]
MATAAQTTTAPTRVGAVASSSRPRTSARNEGSIAGEPSSSQVAHTLTACTRCRQRKTRCDPGLPRCGPCDKASATCEYFDSNKGRNVNRNYVVYLQHKVRELEQELEKVENEDGGDDPDTLMRAATVRMHDAQDTKYLGPSSGIAITRLVMQLAKQFTDAKSIKDIVPEHRAQQIKELYHREQEKPTSKIYPLISNVAAADLPQQHLTDLVVQLYKLRVQPLYPALHEPTLDRDIEAVYTHGDTATPFQNFICRLVIAISLQKMDTQYAGLADSYYLAALKWLEPVVKPMDLKTLQCFALMAEYSMLTPTRTAIYYVVGIAVRLLQSLGYHEEKTIVRGRADGQVDVLEIDMRRRLFWCIMVMDWGLAHSLGRPSMLATSQDHIDVKWFETCDDQHIKPEGIDAAAPRPTLKKWVAIHFFKMRLLQLEIRRKLYQRKRSEPTDDSDPWFKDMEAKICAWRDASPNTDGGSGLDKSWFIMRYNTIVVFLYRPSPQVPRPSLDAALKCFDACEYNINIQREQIENRNVDLTWIFTQSLFMAINCMLWSLSYVEVRRRHSRTEVERVLEIAMDAIRFASERWPGVASAVQLYMNLIAAILKIYEKDGDIPIAATTPSEVASPPTTLPDAFSRSRTTSPATVSSTSVATPPMADTAPFGYFQQQARRSVEQPPPLPYSSDLHSMQPNMQHTNPMAPPAHHQIMPLYHAGQSTAQPIQPRHSIDTTGMSFDPTSITNPLPQWLPDLPVPSWPTTHQQQHIPYPNPNPATQLYPDYTNPNQNYDPHGQQQYAFMGMDGTNQGVDQWMNPYWGMDEGSFGGGLNQEQQEQLLRQIETDGMGDIRNMIQATLETLTPKPSENGALS